MDKRYLVTGGSGFIGSNFIHYILKRYPDCSVVNLDKLTYAGNPENLRDVETDPRYRFVQGDICDPDVVDRIVSGGVDYIFNFAAETHVDRSIIEPGAFIRTDVLGTHVILEAVRRHGVERFIQISTDEVYGSLGSEGLFTELTSYDPKSPYSASKAGSDHMVRAYGHTFGLPVVISNCSNNYGPNQFPEKLIPLVINNIRNNRSIPVYGKGENVRDWLYVEDHAAAIDLIFHKGKAGETYNIGGNNEWKNIDLIRLLCRILDSKLGRPEGASEKLITYVKDRPGHDLRYAIDSSKIRSELGWAPIPEFSTGIEKTVDWYLSNDKWLSGILSGDYEKYYEKMYSGRQISF